MENRLHFWPCFSMKGGFVLGFFPARLPGKQDSLNLYTVTSLFSGEKVWPKQSNGCYTTAWTLR